MKMKALIAAVAALSVASAAQAVTVTYVLSLNDNGTGTATANAFAVYAYTSAVDNAGLAAFSVDLNTVGIADAPSSLQTTGQGNRSPFANFNDGDGVPTGQTSGFTGLRFTENGPNPSTPGVASPITGGGFVSNIPAYGIGQKVDTLASVTPTDTTAAGFLTYGVSNSFTVANATGTQTATGGQLPVLLMKGTISSGAFPTLSVLGVSAGVFLPAANGTTLAIPTGSTGVNSLAVVSRNLIVPEPASLAMVGLGGLSLMTRRRKTA